MSEIDTANLREIASAADAVARGPWERDREKQTDAPDKHAEFFAIDGAGNRMFGTENCDPGFGAIEFDYDEGWSNAWNEPSRRVIDHTVAFDPATALALLDEIDRLRAEVEMLRGEIECAEQEAEDLRQEAGVTDLEGQLMASCEDAVMLRALLRRAGGALNAMLEFNEMPIQTKRPDVFSLRLLAQQRVASEIEEAIGHE